MKSRKQLVISAVAVLIIIVLGVWYFNSGTRAQQQFEKAIAALEPEAQTEVQEFLTKAETRWNDSRGSDTDLTGYIDAGRFYKMIGSVYGIDHGYQLAIDVYEEAIGAQGEGNALLYSAAASAYKSLEDHKTAHTYYERAKVLEPGNAQRYTDLASHLRYNFPETPVEDILAIYQEGIDRVVFGGDTILRDRARFYEDVAGDTVAAYQDWARLLIVFPGDGPITSEVLRLKAVLEAEGVEFEAEDVQE